MSPRRPRRSAPDDDDARPTFAEEVAALLESTAQATRETIAASNAAARLRVITCDTCDAPKACCSMVTGAYLHEGAAIAAHLIDTGRDTAALRATLAASAEAMETVDEAAYLRRCAFLGAGDRCTVYDVRPSVCGVHMVSSPAATCAERTATSAVVGAAHLDGPRATDERFRAALGAPATPLRGALPRMVLFCLEAWERRDHLARITGELVPAVHRYRWRHKAS